MGELMSEEGLVHGLDLLFRRQKTYSIACRDEEWS